MKNRGLHPNDIANSLALCVQQKRVWYIMIHQGFSKLIILEVDVPMKNDKRLIDSSNYSL